MALVAIAEVLAGEALISPGGLVDRETACGDSVWWQSPAWLAALAGVSGADVGIGEDVAVEYVSSS